MLEKSTENKLKGELRALQMLCHPYIIKAKQSWFLKTGQLHNVMELADKRDLRAYMKKLNDNDGKKELFIMKPDHILRLFTQLLLALEQAHSQFIVHRNMSNLHVFLKEDKNPDGPGISVLLGNFGNAKV